MLLSILVATNRKDWIEWFTYQIHKLINNQRVFSDIEVLVATEIEAIHFDKDLNVFYHDGNIGTKRNFLMSKAKGSYFMFVDDDDWYNPYRIEMQFACINWSHKLKEQNIVEAKDLQIPIPTEHIENPNNVKACTTQTIDCYDLRIGSYFKIKTGSESCLFLHRDFYDKEDFRFYETNSQEGTSITDGNRKILTIENIVLAFTHKNNTTTRQVVGAKQNVPIKELDPQEKKILRNITKKLKLPFFK